MTDELTDVIQRLDRIEALLSGRKDTSPIVGAQEAARILRVSRATIFREGRECPAVMQYRGHALERGKYNLDELRRARALKPKNERDFLSKPRTIR